MRIRETLLDKTYAVTNSYISRRILEFIPIFGTFLLKNEKSVDIFCLIVYNNHIRK
jgi:hypothetical protein